MKRSCARIAIFVLAACTLSGENLLDRCACADTREALTLLTELSSYKGRDGNLLRGILYHTLAESQREKYVPKAKEALGKAKSSGPVARAYYGSILTMEAGIAFSKNNPVSAFLLIKRGFAEMDRAIGQARDSELVHALRAENSISVSAESPFKRTGVLADDIAFLSKRWEAGTPEQRSRLLFYRGELAALDGDLETALGLYEQSSKAAPGTAPANRSLVRMAELEE